MYHILVDSVKTEVSYKITSNLDFLRGEPGSKYMPIVLDDIDLNTQACLTNLLYYAVL